jgi:hypothetical protein
VVETFADEKEPSFPLKAARCLKLAESFITLGTKPGGVIAGGSGVVEASGVAGASGLRLIEF